MQTRTKSIAVMLAVLLLSAPAFAKVTAIKDYKFGIKDGALGGDGSHAAVNCSSYGTDYFSSKQPNADCTTKSVNGTTCYKCSCNNSKYPFTEAQCSSTGFVLPTTSTQICNVGGTKKYATCNCDTTNGYYASSTFASNFETYFATNTTNKKTYTVSGKTIACYKKDSISCKTSYQSVRYGDLTKVTGTNASNNLTVRVNDDIPYIIYNVKLLLKDPQNDDPSCITGVNKLEVPLYASNPEINQCAEITTEQKAKYHSATKYRYYTGNCSTNSNCMGTNVADCISAQSPEVSYYDTGTKSKKTVACKIAQGCNEGLTTKNGVSYLCSASVPTENSISYTPITSGGTTCYKISGCSNGYENPTSIGTTEPKSKFEKDENYTYDVKESSVTDSTNNTYRIICRKPNGCRTDLNSYDRTCPTGCWNGYYALWFPAGTSE